MLRNTHKNTFLRTEREIILPSVTDDGFLKVTSGDIFDRSDFRPTDLESQHLLVKTARIDRSINQGFVFDTVSIPDNDAAFCLRKLEFCFHIGILYRLFVKCQALTQPYPLRMV